jgi:hypothetical protein
MPKTNSASVTGFELGEKGQNPWGADSDHILQPPDDRELLGSNHTCHWLTYFNVYFEKSSTELWKGFGIFLLRREYCFFYFHGAKISLWGVAFHKPQGLCCGIAN